MNAEMIRRWNSVVGPSDTVYHLGDFALGPKELWHEYRTRLNGRIIFVVGNHDEPEARWRKEVLLEGDERHNSLIYTTSDEIRVSLRHVPARYDDGRTMPDAITHDMSEDGGMRFCGHVHDAWLFDKRTNTLNVGVDQWNFTPQLFSTLFNAVVTETFKGVVR